MPMDDNRALFSALGLYLIIWLPLWGCVSVQLLQELPLKFAWLLQRPPLFSISPQVLLQMSFGAYGCRNYHGEVFFLGPKTGPWKIWFLHVSVDGDPVKIGLPWWKPPSSGASKLGTSRSFLSDLRRVWWTSQNDGSSPRRISLHTLIRWSATNE